MKKLLPILGIAFFAIVLFASCGNKQSSDQVALNTVDTSGLAQFDAWKKQQEFAAQYAIYEAAAAKNTPATSNKAVARKTKETTGSMSTSTSYPAKAAKKKGWSNAAKGAVIGGVVGAAGGAVIYKKNRVLGGVIGGVVGAAGGFGIGKHLDKKAEGK
jgi:hypothetical protein